jgi:sec-independent protein translocase protein TatA
VLLFGASKIPKLARSSGQAIGEFQKGREQVEQELDEMRDATSLEDSDDDGLVDTEPVTTETESETSSGSGSGSTSGDSN